MKQSFPHFWWLLGINIHFREAIFPDVLAERLSSPKKGVNEFLPVGYSGFSDFAGDFARAACLSSIGREGDRLVGDEVEQGLDVGVIEFTQDLPNDISF